MRRDPDLVAAVAAAHPPSLLAALVTVLGDASLLEGLRPERYRLLDPSGGMSAEQVEGVRRLALDALPRILDGSLTPAPGSVDLARTLLEPYFRPGQVDDYAEMSIEELGLLAPDPRAPAWRAGPHAPSVVVIGAGMSGLLAARRLQQAGLDFVVLDRNGDLGGTWLANAYPGCRVDVPSHLYSYSAEAEVPWRDHFSPQADVLDYFRAFADEHDLRAHVRFGCEVESLTFDDEALRWTVEVRTADGTTEVLVADAVISAVGQLSRPSIPDLPGLDAFAGDIVHSAAWDPTVPLAGRRVGVIGTGASGIQIVPALVDAGAAVTVFQRHPAWLMPTPELRQPIDADHARLLAILPTYARWYRFWAQQQVSDGMLPYATFDPGWPHQDRSVSEPNDRMRRRLHGYLEQQFAGHPDLLGAMVPDYPPFAKRAVRDDGSWAAAFTSRRAHLEGGVASVTPDGVVTAEGRSVPLDVLVLATGFRATEFLMPMRVTGRGGRDLHGTWGGDATAYLGVTVPGFPNLFLLYGPNTNIVVNGSAILFTECELSYVLSALEALDRQPGALDVRPEVHGRFADEVDRTNRQRAWGCTDVDSWYRSRSGRVTQNWHSTVLDFWQRTRRIDPADYEWLQRVTAVR